VYHELLKVGKEREREREESEEQGSSKKHCYVSGGWEEEHRFVRKLMFI